MRVLALRLPNGYTLLSAGRYCGQVFVWVGARQVWPRHRPAPQLVPVMRPEPVLRLDRGGRAGW